MKTQLNPTNDLSINSTFHQLIEKEEIPHLHFPKEEVLRNHFERFQRDKDLEHAIVLGNIYRFKVKIVFEDIEGTKSVHTTIWGITDQQIILKKNVTVPINRVHQIIY